MQESATVSTASLAEHPWRPASLRAPTIAFLDRRSRVLLLALIVLAHAITILLLQRMVGASTSSAVGSALIVGFVVDPPRQAAPRTPLRSTASASNESLRETPVTSLDTSPTQVAPTRVVSGHPPERETEPDDRLPVYTPEGRVRTPGDLLDQIDRKLGDKRVFSYQVPRMDDARKLFYRNPPVVYQATRFDQYWKPDEDLLTDLLTQMVEKTTKEIRIPVPGQPGSTMVCKVSLLALGGGCGVLTNGADYVGPIDDPETLDLEEDRQCKVWWDQIIGATTQDVWRRTRALYESQCRKPLLREGEIRHKNE